MAGKTWTPLPDFPTNSAGQGRYASMLLDSGLSVPEVQERLLALGISPTQASAIVERLLDAQIRQQVSSQKRTDRWRFLNRFFSALVAGVYVIGAYKSGGGPSAFDMTLELILPLACIWFGVEAAKHFANVEEESTPSFVIRLMGWLLLLLIGIFMVL